MYLYRMPVLEILTLTTVIVTAFSQLIQMFFDYKKAQLDKQHDHIYTLTSNCCSRINESEEAEK